MLHLEQGIGPLDSSQTEVLILHILWNRFEVLIDVFVSKEDAALFVFVSSFKPCHITIPFSWESPWRCI